MAFHVDRDIRIASTIPSDFYRQAQYFELSKEKIFARTWQFAGDTDQVNEPGWVTPLNLLENFVDEPLLLSRDAASRLYCLSNVCTHRGNLRLS